jgi:hypothetical protein
VDEIDEFESRRWKPGFVLFLHNISFIMLVDANAGVSANLGSKWLVSSSFDDVEPVVTGLFGKAL